MASLARCAAVAAVAAVVAVGAAGGCTRPNPEFGLLLVGGTEGAESDATGSGSDSGGSATSGTTRGSASQGSASGGGSSVTTAGVTSDEPSSSSSTGPSSSSVTSNSSSSGTTSGPTTDSTSAASSSSTGSTTDPDPSETTTGFDVCPAGVERVELVPDADTWVMRGEPGLNTCVWTGSMSPLPLPCSLVNFGTTSVHFVSAVDAPNSVMLLGFPLDELPLGARIRTARLSLRVEAIQEAPPGVELKVYALSSERFAEGNADGGLSLTGGVTWDCLIGEGPTCVPWPGGSGPLEGASFVGAVALSSVPDRFELIELSNTAQLEQWRDPAAYAVYAVSAAWPRSDALFTYARESGASTPALELEYCLP